jgi:hypothetical protein
MGNDNRRAKAIGRAFSFHPGIWSGPKRVGSWVIGPTFAVQAEEEDSYPEVKAYQGKLKEWVEKSGDSAPVEIVERPHYRKGLKSTCKSRRLQGGGGSPMEVAYALVALGKLAGAKRWTAAPTAEGKPVALYGWNEDRLVLVAAAKLEGDNCGKEKAAGGTGKKVPSRPRGPKGKVHQLS